MILPLRRVRLLAKAPRSPDPILHELHDHLLCTLLSNPASLG